MPESPFVVRNTRFSEVIARQDMDVFMRVCPERPYDRGEAVFRAGDPALEMHVIAKGRVKVTVVTPDGEERILAICGPDDFIGDAFVVQGAAYRAEAVALTDVVTCPISRDQFLQMALKAPGFVLGVCEILSGHLFDCRAQLASGYDPVMVRVAKVLLGLAERFGEPDDEGWVTLASNLKHEEIASMVSATRVSVTMAVGELRERGLLEGSRGTYRLHAPALASLADASEDG
ncbi:MAG: Crp/Fnr family transcriptional regulator [Deinococcales bacterium]